MAVFSAYLSVPSVMFCTAANTVFPTVLAPTATDQVDPVASAISIPSPLGKDDPIVLEVQDVTNALGKVIILVSWPGKGDYAWDGDAFSDDYAGSTVETISDGFRYTLRRALGWPVPMPETDMRIRVFAVDVAGNVAP
jgi:hypothetical protein